MRFLRFLAALVILGSVVISACATGYQESSQLGADRTVYDPYGIGGR